MDSLLPCPFCGGPGEIDQSIGSQASASDYVYSARCSWHEHANGDWVSDRDTAIAAWNTRSDATEQQYITGGLGIACARTAEVVFSHVSERERREKLSLALVSLTEEILARAALPKNRKPTDPAWLERLVTETRDYNRIRSEELEFVGSDCRVELAIAGVLDRILNAAAANEEAA